MCEKSFLHNINSNVKDTDAHDGFIKGIVNYEDWYMQVTNTRDVLSTASRHVQVM